jgi:hypothetical protein
MAGTIHVLLLQIPHEKIYLWLGGMESPMQLNTLSNSWNRNNILYFDGSKIS